MTLKEWGAIVSRELAAGGFDVGELHGFPIVKCPATLGDTVRLMKFTLSLAADRRIYAEGILFIPAGSWEAAHQRLKDPRRPDV